jgi:hypothetical protein
MPVLSAREMEGVNLPAPGSADYWEDSKWASENLTEIVKKYPNLYVAIVDKRVVAAAKTIAEVEEACRIKTGRKDIPIYLAEKGIRVYNH